MDQHVSSHCSRPLTKAIAPEDPAVVESLWLALDVPSLLLTALGLAERQEAWVITDGAHVKRGNPAAVKLGIVPGMRIGVAQALGTFQIKACDEIAERQALTELATWAMRFTSLVSLVPPTGLVLEIGRSLTLFRGLQSLLDALHTDITALGYAACFAVAPTPLAACWFAHARQRVCITRLAQLPASLARLPVTLLASTAREAERFQNVGLATLGECLRLPRTGLAQRFGPAVVSALDRALGRRPDPQTPFEPPESFERRMDLLYETDKIDHLLSIARRWLGELAGFLRTRGAGTQRLDWRLLHRDRRETPFCITLTYTSRDPGHWEPLLRLQLEQLRLPEPVRALALRVTDIHALTESSGSLFPEAEDQHRVSSAALLDRLCARLGPAAISGLDLVADHRPEAAWCFCPPGEANKSRATRGRPLWLFPQPQLLSVRRGCPQLRGPLRLLGRAERIEGGWWDSQGGVARDYFIGTHASGTRYWLFREVEGQRRWFVHGLFD
jgi:protein ImuB